jgi:hypothetical protein
MVYARERDPSDLVITELLLYSASSLLLSRATRAVRLRSHFYVTSLQ